MHRFRIFLSYSHQDAALQEAIRRHLEEGLGCTAMRDVAIHAGSPFHEEIRDLIAHAHVFMPILTERSAARPWVNQEIGYALGLNVPTLPLAIGSIPDGLLGSYQALPIAPDLSDLPARLTREAIERAVYTDPYEQRRPATFECASEPEERTRMLVSYARGVTRHGYGRIRHRGAFTSFGIPKDPVFAAIWARRDGERQHSDHDREWHRREREVLEQHARAEGVSLLLDPVEDSEVYSSSTLATRLEILRDFLVSMPESLVDVAIADSRSHGENVIIVGDWFLAEAVVPRGGGRFRKTVFTRHGPTVLSRIRQFDAEMEHWKQGMDRECVLETIRTRIQSLRQA